MLLKYVLLEEHQTVDKRERCRSSYATEAWKQRNLFITSEYILRSDWELDARLTASVASAYRTSKQ